MTGVEAYMIYPDYYPGYQCKCGECRRSCCQGDWDISLCREEYLADIDPGLGPKALTMAKEGIQVNENSQDEEHYAQMAIGEDGRCRFLTKDGLCGWLLETKSDVGSVCRDFPRIYIRFLQDTYIFPSVTCEAVLELLFRKKDVVRLIWQEKEAEELRYYAKVTEEQIQRRPLLGIYPELVQYGLGILQNRNYTLDQRMQLLAFSVYRIDQMERVGAVDGILAELNQLSQEQVARHYLETFASCYGGIQAVILVCGDIYSLFCRKKVYQRTAEKILRGLGVGLTEDGSPCLVDREIYIKRKDAKRDYMEKIEYFLEHVITSVFLHNLVPLGEPGPWQNIQYTIACYTLLKGGIIGYFDTIPPNEALIDMVVEIMRMCSHNNALYEKILNRFKEVKLDSLTAMTALIGG